MVETATGSLLNSMYEKELTLIRDAIEDDTEATALLLEKRSGHDAVELEVSQHRYKRQEMQDILYDKTDESPCPSLPWWEDESKLPPREMEAWKACGALRTNKTNTFGVPESIQRLPARNSQCPLDVEHEFLCSHAETYPPEDQCSRKVPTRCGIDPTVLGGDAPTCPNGEPACCCLPNGQKCTIDPNQESKQETAAALLLVDVQDCFLDKETASGLPGSLPVTNSSAIIPVINSLNKRRCLFDLVVKTADYHPRDHISFASTHGLPGFYNFDGDPEGIPLVCGLPKSLKMSDSACCPKRDEQSNSLFCPDPLLSKTLYAEQGTNRTCPKDGPATTSNLACSSCNGDSMSEKCFELNQHMWPVHCLQDGDWTYPPGLEKFNEGPGAIPEVEVKLGRYPFIDSYSAFWDNSMRVKTELDDVLRAAKITKLYVTGLATDFTVQHTALAAIDLGYEVVLVTDAIKGIDKAQTETAMAKMDIAPWNTMA